MIVMKFGGTSVQDAISIRTVCEIIAARADQNPFIVVSACAGVTSSLMEIAQLAANDQKIEALERLSVLRARHQKNASDLLPDGHTIFTLLKKDFNELRRLIQGVSALRQLTPRTLDQIAAYGELWSSSLLCLVLKERGLSARVIDARSVMVTDENFTSAEPILDLIKKKAREVFSPAIEAGTVVVTQGFIGATEGGITTTIGRGGSDYTASIFGAVLDADEIQIWTDVDGILTADPSLLPEAQLIKEMTFNEASELAYFGAKVLHPSTILPAIKKGIPVRVLNSKRRSNDGTLISEGSRTSSECLLKSIAYKEDITVVTIQSTRMLMNHGFLARVFDTFARHQKGVDVVATSEVGISLTIDNDTRIEPLVSELLKFADVRVEKNKAVVCVVGENLKYTKGIAARVFTALSDAGVNIELISHGGSEINLTFVIDESQIARAVKSLHGEFFSAVIDETLAINPDTSYSKNIDSPVTFP